MIGQLCKTCKGRGRWQEMESSINQGTLEEISMVWKECNDCRGTGRQVLPEELDVYDVAGEDEDDD